MNKSISVAMLGLAAVLVFSATSASGECIEGNACDAIKLQWDNSKGGYWVKNAGNRDVTVEINVNPSPNPNGCGGTWEILEVIRSFLLAPSTATGRPGTRIDLVL